MKACIRRPICTVCAPLALLLTLRGSAQADEKTYESAKESSECDSSKAEEPPRLNLEAAAYLSASFLDLAVPDQGTLNPIGGSGLIAVRFLPADFPFHAYATLGGGRIATGTSTGPSGTLYDNSLNSWYGGSGIGYDLGPMRATVGLGVALSVTRHESSRLDETTSSLALSSELGLAYIFSRHDTWTTSIDFRYLRVAATKIDSLMLGVRVHYQAFSF